MPNSENKDAIANDSPPWWKRLVAGAIVGGFFGALEIWFYEFSLNRLLAAVLSGASFFMIVGLLGVKLGGDHSRLVALAGGAGLIAGVVYWIMARPAVSPVLAVVIGLVVGVLFAWLETRSEDPEKN